LKEVSSTILDINKADPTNINNRETQFDVISVVRKQPVF